MFVNKAGAFSIWKLWSINYQKGIGLYNTWSFITYLGLISDIPHTWITFFTSKYQALMCNLVSVWPLQHGNEEHKRVSINALSLQWEDEQRRRHCLVLICSARGRQVALHSLHSDQRLNWHTSAKTTQIPYFNDNPKNNCFDLRKLNQHLHKMLGNIYQRPYLVRVIQIVY